MPVFVTGATGYVGWSVATAFRRAGHRVWGLTRSEVKARRLAQILPGMAGSSGLMPQCSSQRLQEFDDGLLLAARQLPESLCHSARFATMPDDGVAQREGCLVVHQPRAQTDTP